MFVFELSWSADIPATLNTGSPSFGASSGLPVSKTSWHCCGSQYSPALWPQNKASGARHPVFERPAGCSSCQGSVCLSEVLAQRAPLPRAARPQGQDHLTAGWQVAPGRAGLRSRAQEVSLSLRQLSRACCGRRLPRRRQSPAPSRRTVGCMSSSRLYSPPPPALRPRRPPRPQLSRSRHANFWLGTKGSARAGRGRAFPAAPRGPFARRSLEVLGWPAALLPLPRAAAPRRPARAAPLNARERDAEGPGKEGGGGAAAGAGKSGEPSGEAGGRRRRLEAEAPKEGLRVARGSRAWAPTARLTRPTPTAPLSQRESPAPREGAGRGQHRARLRRAAQFP